MPWIVLLFEALVALFPLPPGLDIAPADLLRPSRITITSLQETRIEHPTPQNGQSLHFATLKTNQRITADDWYQDVRHMEFELDSQIEYVASFYID